jgi:hypothetical protein
VSLSVSKFIASYNILKMDVNDDSPCTFDRIWGQKKRGTTVDQRTSQINGYTSPLRQSFQEGKVL